MMLSLFAVAAVSLAATAPAATPASAPAAPAGRPNVLLIMTDDQGWGDLSVHGNPILKTPNLDRLANGGVQLTRFYVSPVCSPTRSALLTGRYTYRTGVVDTYLGRSMMHNDELTLAEILSAAGYHTGQFGKWHLGDCAPMRPSEQGFAESLTIRGGGLGQPSDFPDGGRYFDPICLRNGKPERTRGYCTDVFTDAALSFITAATERSQPWFAYIAYNAPHGPLEVADELVAPLRKEDYSSDKVPTPPGGRTVTGKIDPETTARVYAMCGNIDVNVGRLLDRLDQLKITERTLVIFLTDNGPQQPRYNGGMRGLKGTVYEGGIRVPSFWRMPGTLPTGARSDRVSAHIDVVPTVLDLCGVAPPASSKFDGVSRRSVLTAKDPAATPTAEPGRAIFVQWHRGDVPLPGRAAAVITQRWKLVQPNPNRDGSASTADWELYDIAADFAEQKNVAAEHPDIVADLRKQYDVWYSDVRATRQFAPPRIWIGDPSESPTVLTRQDWRGVDAGWTEKSHGHWLVEVRTAGRYRFLVRTLSPRAGGKKAEAPTAVTLIVEPAGQSAVMVSLTQQPDKTWLSELVAIPAGPARIVAGTPAIHQVEVTLAEK